MSHHDPEVITDHTEIISSISIECIVTGRNNELEKIEVLIYQLDEIIGDEQKYGG